MLNGDFVKASAITWLSTFGRHILNISYDSILINIKKVKGSCSDENNYEVSVIPSVEDNKKICFLKTFASKVLEKETYSCTKGFLVTKEGIKLGFDKNRPCEFLQNCSYMRVYNNPKKVITNVLNQN